MMYTPLPPSVERLLLASASALCILTLVAQKPSQRSRSPFQRTPAAVPATCSKGTSRAPAKRYILLIASEQPTMHQGHMAKSRASGSEWGGEMVHSTSTSPEWVLGAL